MLDVRSLPNGYVGDVRLFIVRLLEARVAQPLCPMHLSCHGLLLFLYQTPIDPGMTSSYENTNGFVSEYPIPVVL